MPSQNPTVRSWDCSAGPSHGCGVVQPLGAGNPPGFRGSPWAQGVFPSLCPAVEAPLEPMSGLALFLIVFFSLVAIVFAIVIGIIVYNKWQEQSRKHFY